MTFPETTRRKVREAARELNYVPNQFARGLKTNQSRLIGLLLPTISNPYYQTLAQHIEEYAASKGYNILLCNTSRLADREESYISLLKSKSADGIIYTFAPLLPDKARQVISADRMVIIGENEPNLGFKTVSLDSYIAGQIVAKYLMDLGHKRIGFVTSPLSGFSLSRKSRLDGVIAAMRAAGLEDALVIKEGKDEKEINDSSFEIDIGFSLTEELLREHDVTAIIGVNDMVAFGALSHILRTDLRVPEDISVCGFDNIYLSRILKPHITTVDHDIADKARAAVEMIIASVEAEGEDERSDWQMDLHVNMNGPKLITRESTGPSPN